eukprot:364956-Chlamydomonas_euryale.AAC.2
MPAPGPVQATSGRPKSSGPASSSSCAGGCPPLPAQTSGAGRLLLLRRALRRASAWADFGTASIWSVHACMQALRCPRACAHIGTASRRMECACMHAGPAASPCMRNHWHGEQAHGVCMHAREPSSVPLHAQPCAQVRIVAKGVRAA